MPQTTPSFALWLPLWALLLVIAHANWQSAPFNLDAFLDSCGGSSEDYFSSSNQPSEGLSPCDDEFLRIFCEDVTLTVCYCVPVLAIQSEGNCTIENPEFSDPCTNCTICTENNTCFVDMPQTGRLDVGCVEYEPYYDSLAPTFSPAPSVSPQPTRAPSPPTPSPTGAPDISAAQVTQGSDGLLTFTHVYKNPDEVLLTIDAFSFYGAPRESGAAVNDPRMACPLHNPNAVPLQTGILDGRLNDPEDEIFVDDPISGPGPSGYSGSIDFEVVQLAQSSALLVEGFFGESQPYLLFCILFTVRDGQDQVTAQRETAIWLNVGDGSLGGFVDPAITDSPTMSPTTSPTPAPTMNPTPSIPKGHCIHPDPDSSFLETMCTGDVPQTECENVFDGSVERWYEGTSCPNPRMMHCPPKTLRQIVRALYCWKKSLTRTCRCY